MKDVILTVFFVWLVNVQLNWRPVLGATWYVDSNAAGSTQVGTQANPCLSLSCALSLTTLGNGDRISVASGEYKDAANSQLSTSKVGISIVGAGLPSTVVLRSTVTNTRAFTISAGSIVLLQNLTIQNFYLHPSGSLTGAGVFVGDKTNVTLRNLD